MTVQVIIRNKQNEEVITFPGEDYKTFFQMAKDVGLDLPISCGIGVCGFCRSHIVTGKEFIDFGKKSLPLKELGADEIFICVGGILTSALQDKEDHKIILQVKI